jgi:hypothetical protein
MEAIRWAIAQTADDPDVSMLGLNPLSGRESVPKVIDGSTRSTGWPHTPLPEGRLRLRSAAEAG